MNKHAYRFKLELPSSTAYLQLIGFYVSEVTKSVGLSMREIKQIELALDEACTNIIEHGYEFDDTKSFSIECLLTDNEIEFIIEDRGKSFDPNSVNLKFEDIDRENPKEGGLGIFLMKRVMDKIVYNTDSNGVNRLKMTKQIKVQK